MLHFYLHETLKSCLQETIQVRHHSMVLHNEKNLGLQSRTKAGYTCFNMSSFILSCFMQPIGLKASSQFGLCWHVHLASAKGFQYPKNVQWTDRIQSRTEPANYSYGFFSQTRFANQFGCLKLSME